MEANNWIAPSQKQLWSTKPHEAVTSFSNLEQKNFWNKILANHSFVAMVDGSWMKHLNRGGIGGIVRNEKGVNCFLFQDPQKETLFLKSNGKQLHS